MVGRRQVVGVVVSGLVLSFGFVGVVGVAPVGADEARCIGYLHQQGFEPGAVHPSSYAIAEMACEAGASGSSFVCNSLMVLAVEDHNATSDDDVDPWQACTYASWVTSHGDDGP
jgi:hypothetical protein